MSRSALARTGAALHDGGVQGAVDTDDDRLVELRMVRRELARLVRVQTERGMTRVERVSYYNLLAVEAQLEDDETGAGTRARPGERRASSCG